MELHEGPFDLFGIHLDDFNKNKRIVSDQKYDFTFPESPHEDCDYLEENKSSQFIVKTQSFHDHNNLITFSHYFMEEIERNLILLQSTLTGLILSIMFKARSHLTEMDLCDQISWKFNNVRKKNGSKYKVIFN